MARSLNLGPHYEAFISGQLSSGHYADASDVVRDALPMMEESQSRLKAVDESVAEGLADVTAGRVYDLNEVLEEIEAEIERAPSHRDR